MTGKLPKKISNYELRIYTTKLFYRDILDAHASMKIQLLLVSVYIINVSIKNTVINGLHFSHSTEIRHRLNSPVLRFRDIARHRERELQIIYGK